MSPLSIRCVKAAFVYLALGIGLGVTFAFDRALGARLRPLHAELNLWGWATLLIYGMAYHMLPRFLGHALHWERLAQVQSWLAISGVTLAALGWIVTVKQLSFGNALLVVGDTLELLAALVFAALVGALLWRSAPPKQA